MEFKYEENKWACGAYCETHGISSHRNGQTLEGGVAKKSGEDYSGR